MQKTYASAADLLAELARSRTKVMYFDTPEPPSTFARGHPVEFESLTAAIEAIGSDRTERRYYDLVIYPLGDEEIALPRHISTDDLVEALRGFRRVEG